MNEWREDNFLERLTHNSREHAGPGSCPETEILCSTAGSESNGPISAKLLKHIEHCEMCSNLWHRLALFDQPESLGLDSEAIEVERRLDSWLKGFLVAQPGTIQAQPDVSAPKLLSYPLKGRRLWKMEWALAAAAIAVIAVGVGHFRRPITAQTPAPMTAQTTAEGQSLARANSQAPFEKHSATEQNPQEGGRENARASRPSKVVSPRKITAPAPVPNSSPTIPSSPVALAPSQSLSDGATITARTAPPASNSASPAYRGSGFARNGVRINAASPRAGVPPTVQLPAGTRIWLTLDSVASDPDGRFQFRAVLLLPVAASGTLLLDKGVQVLGSGRTIQNETSIQITELATNGQRYILSPASSGVSKIPGSGKAVRFESGQVLEMWVDSASTFAAAGGSSASPPN
jgi:hypothetical protein